MVRTALRAILDAEPDLEVVGEAADGAEAVPSCAQLRPDVVLMDVRMPEIDGIRATEQILARSPSRPGSSWSPPSRTTPTCTTRCAPGRTGFLLKRAAAEELVQAVRLVARSDSLLFPAAVRSLAAEHARAHAPAGAGAARLTEREAEVLRLMAQGLTNAEIARRMGVGPATVKTHVAAVLAKTGARDRTQAVIAAYEAGFMNPDEKSGRKGTIAPVRSSFGVG